ncbi:MAG: hypothetical protein HY650_05370 [Acidobacteria bacterium]|nr:hypothetical protein [Acidobacteriota bacterium]
MIGIENEGRTAGCPRSHRNRRAGVRGQDGYVLIMILGALTVMLIFITGYLPDVMRDVQREREEEMLFRGQAIVNGVALYQTKVQRWPASLKQLSEGVLTSGNRRLRFIRPSALKDPMSVGAKGEGKWRVVRFHDPVIKDFLDAYMQSVGQVPNAMLAKYTGVVTKGLGDRSDDPDENRAGLAVKPAVGGVSSGMGTGIGMPSQQTTFPGQPNFGNPGTTFGQPGQTTGRQGLSAAGTNASQTLGETLDENGIAVKPMLGVVSLSKRESVRVFYDTLDNYDEWAFIFIPELGNQPAANQDARLNALLSPIIFPSDPLAQLIQQVRSRGGARTQAGPNSPLQGIGQRPVPVPTTPRP